MAHHTNKTASKERLSVLTEAEQEALYGLADFDEAQQQEFLSLSANELALARNRPDLSAQVYCILQIGYFKAKQAFFRFSPDEVESDYHFVMYRYFRDTPCEFKMITDHEYYTQRKLIARLFGYRLWVGEFLPQLVIQAEHLACRDITPGFIATELICWLNDNKIVRPGYSTFQKIISKALVNERQRLADILSDTLQTETREALDTLLVKEDALSELAALKQDAKSFRWRQMLKEREKRTLITPIYWVAKSLLPRLGTSQQNLLYFASLVSFYTIYDLRNLKKEQTWLYLLCYVWLRYRQLSDNLVSALIWHMRQTEERCSAEAKKNFEAAQLRRQQDNQKLGRVLSLFVDDNVPDNLFFGDVRQQAWKIMPRDSLQQAALQMSSKPDNKLVRHWKAVDTQVNLIRRHLRPLFCALDFSSVTADCPWLAALAWIKEVFSRQQRLTQRPLTECPTVTLPKRLRSWLLILDEKGHPVGLQADRYEFWLYRQLRKRFESGELYLDDSLQHRHLSDELVSMKDKDDILAQMDIPFLRHPIEQQLETLTKELHLQWIAFNRELKQGKLPHLEFDKATQKLSGHKIESTEKSDSGQEFYTQLPFSELTDVFRFVNQQCQFLSAMTPIQPRYAKKEADADSLMAVIVAQAMNHGNRTLARTSDIPYHVLNEVYAQYLRLSSLKSATDRISNAIKELPVFPYYSLELGTLYAAVDGQKFSVEHPMIKARGSKKYFGRGKGVVAYTMLCNHIPLNGYLIGAHEYEAHHVFDIWYRNTAGITPTTITGDMHSVNKANFAILHWFGLRFEPRFTSPGEMQKELYCADNPEQYKTCLIQPVGQINQKGIIDEKSHLDQIVATLGFKAITQGALIRKLCTYTTKNPTRQALFEFDKLIRSLYILRYLRNPQISRNSHRSQNRIESYHQLRSAIAQVGGKKELTGQNDIEIEISNQCGRLLASVIIYYNPALLSRLMQKSGDSLGDIEKAGRLISKISPVAWQHILLNGHYTFNSEGKKIDLDAILEGLKLI
ncbi:Tn3 family transposase [Xenorhabdus sp. XENO-1]|uniref:Tn3 family transposase n=1 Tax=Xenorhabdus bovienii TaxID=40576 RepID=UPI0020CA853D|nr:Tn3 family transposase [Xenorhabdus bovienii]MCP9270254.1 Tn3 family transposase [Xenorhabdus bovienii subsp. africana]